MPATDTPNTSPLTDDIKAPSERVIQWLRLAVYGCAAFSVLLFVVTAVLRLSFPFQYDHIEQGMVVCLRHVMAGGPLYQSPTIEYTPFLYTPLYFYVSALFGKLTGSGYYTLRLVSLLSTLGCFAVIALHVWRETRNKLAAAAAVGIFAACYPAVRAWFDIGRVDMLALFFILAALYVTRFGRPAIAALLWVLAFQSKQGCLPFAVLILCYDVRHPKRILEGLLTFGVLLCGSIFWLNHVFHGWYSYYVFKLTAGLGTETHLIVLFLTDDVLLTMSSVVILIAAGAFTVRGHWLSRRAFFYVLSTASIMLFTGFVRSHRGAATNALLPIYGWLSVVAGVALAHLLHLARDRNRAVARAVTAALLVAVLVQIAERFYSPRHYDPNKIDLVMRTDFEQQLAAIPGDVIVLTFPVDATMAGKPQYASSEATGGVIDSPVRAPGDILMASYADHIHRTAWSAVVTDNRADQIHGPRQVLPQDFEEFYPLRIEAAGTRDDRLSEHQPHFIYFPCRMATVAKQMDPRIDTAVCAAK